MKKIEVKILNPESIDQAEKMMVCAARLPEIYCRKSCKATASDHSEIWNHQCGGRWSIQTIPGTDHQTPERSEVYVSKSAIQ